MELIRHIKIRNFVFLLSLVYFSFACSRETTDPEPVGIDTCLFATSPQNMDILNTEFDEYNMNINYVGQVFDLYYSTNRASLGNDFDIAGRRLETVVDPDTELFTFRFSSSEPTYAWKLLSKINTGSDEVGPFSFYSDSVVNSSTIWYFFFASKESGNFEIRFAYTIAGDWEGKDARQQIFGPYDAVTLSFDRDDFYPTIDSGHTRLYFSSNRHKYFDIYRVELGSHDLVKQLQEDKPSGSKEVALSSYSDDKCPYIKGNLVVFSSNRPNGFGGYDLWYSVFDNGGWGEPQNFGPEINTEFDEFSPAVEFCPHSTNDLMIFSSNRPGGKGGFDFYYLGIPKMIN